MARTVTLDEPAANTEVHEDVPHSRARLMDLIERAQSAASVGRDGR